MSSLSSVFKQATGVVVDHAEGVYLHGTDGRTYLDFTAGIGVVSTGHCHPDVVAAAREQVGKLIHGQATTVMHTPMLELAAALVRVAPEGLDATFFGNSGSEAVEAAMRLARMATGRPNIIAFHGGFHGRTVGAASLTSASTRTRSGFAPLMGGVVFSPFPYAFHYGWSIDEAVDFCIRELDYTLHTMSHPKDTAAFLIEPMLGDGGYVPTPPRFLEHLRHRANEIGALLVLDEVQMGFGRTGKFWGHQYSTITPDILITAKGIASGFPLSGILAPAELMAKAWAGSQGGTYSGNAVSCAAALASLAVIEREHLVEASRVLGERLQAGLAEVASRHPSIGDVRGLGLARAIEFVTPEGLPDSAKASAVMKTAPAHGLLVLTCGAYENSIRMVPPLVVTAEQVDEAIARLEQTIDSVEAT